MTEGVNEDNTDEIIVDLGCGRNKHPNSTIGVDNRIDTDADVISDLREGIPFKTSSIDCLYALDVIEHLGDGLADLIQEVHRVLQVKGEFIVRVPELGEDPPSKNPLHKREFHPAWFWSWDPERQEHCKWDNFTCIPFTVTETDKIYKGDFPDRYYKVKTREYTLTKRKRCPDHPVVEH